MSQRIGIDLVHIPKFSEKIRDEALLKRLFTDQELQDARGSVETLAGMFAAKEAYFKAVKQPPSWQSVQLEHKEDGVPHVQAKEPSSVSISHDGEYAIACVMITS